MQDLFGRIHLEFIRMPVNFSDFIHDNDLASIKTGVQEGAFMNSDCSMPRDGESLENCRPNTQVVYDNFEHDFVTASVCLVSTSACKAKRVL